MKVLLIGDPDSYWSKEFIQNVLLPMKADIYVLYNQMRTESFCDFYTKNGVHVIIPSSVPAWVMGIPKVRALAMTNKQRAAIQQYSPFDVIINMFVSSRTLMTILPQRKQGTRVFAYFCGSDIIQATRWTVFTLMSVLRKVDYAVFASCNVENAYLQKTRGRGFCKTMVARLGLSVFSYIDSAMKHTGISNCKERLDIPPYKTSICIGYSGSKAQNHLLALEQIMKLQPSIKERLFLLLPMTYGGTDPYINLVEKAVMSVGCEYRVFREYMGYGSIAELRLATDIFINAQNTDGLSGSVLEALYAGAQLLNASWLKYREYDEWGIKYTVFKDYPEIPDLITNLLSNSKKRQFSNKSILDDKMSWHSCAAKWTEIITGNKPE